MELQGKVALVLGAIKGIGKGVGLALAREGVQVVLNYFDWEESLEEMKQAFEETGCDYHIVRTDLLDVEKISFLVDEVVEKFGGIDILINNIERGGWPVVHGAYVGEQWDLEMATTLRAKWWVYSKALPHLKASGDGVVVSQCNPEAFGDMVDHMNYGGKIALLGIPPQAITVDMTQIVIKGLWLKGIYGREMFETWYKMATMLQGDLDITAVITHRFHIDQYQEAFKVMRLGQSGKVLLEW